MKDCEMDEYKSSVPVNKLAHYHYHISIILRFSEHLDRIITWKTNCNIYCSYLTYESWKMEAIKNFCKTEIFKEILLEYTNRNKSLSYIDIASINFLGTEYENT